MKSEKDGVQGSLPPLLSHAYWLPQPPILTRGGSPQIHLFSYNLGLSIAQTTL